MSSASSDYQRGLLVTVWMVTGLATIALGARLWTRYWRFSKFYWDDLFVFVAWVFSVSLLPARWNTQGIASSHTTS
ncbi:hypothetical protein N0V90_009932 [Kalmusia sp. IMI 367209]|nr:hypothetical protein N0V90_009932 [Kalmusia sp. IMI 367209]